MSVSVAFCWQDKRALRLIRDRVEGSASALVVYLAMTEAASDAGNDQFTLAQGQLASLAGLTTRTLRKRIRELQRLGIVDVVTPALDAPATFRLLPAEGAPTLGNGCRALGNKVRALGNGEGTSASGHCIEERKKRRNGPLTPSERVSIEKNLDRMRRQERELRPEAMERWIRESCPEKGEELKALQGRIAEAEARLEASP